LQFYYLSVAVTWYVDTGYTFEEVS